MIKNAIITLTKAQLSGRHLAASMYNSKPSPFLKRVVGVTVRFPDIQAFCIDNDNTITHKNHCVHVKTGKGLFLFTNALDW